MYFPHDGDALVLHPGLRPDLGGWGRGLRPDLRGWGLGLRPDLRGRGLGLRPDLCGQGLSRELLGLAIAEARRRAAGAPVTLLVRRFNARAMAAYRRAGFVLVGDADDVLGDTPGGDPQERLVMVLAG